MSERIGRILRGQIVSSIIYIALGLCLICMPVETVNIVCKLVFGITIIIAGLYHVAIYALEKMNATVLDLFSGGILLVLGGFLFTNPQVVVKLLPILLGAFVLVDSIWTLKGAFRLKKRGRETWKALMLGSLVFIGLGIAMIVNPFQTVKYTMMFAGWVLLCNGVIDIAFMVVVRLGMKELKEAVEEAVEAANEIPADQTGGTGETKTDAEAEGEPAAEPSWSFLKKREVVAEQELKVVAGENPREVSGEKPAAGDDRMPASEESPAAPEKEA